MNVFILNSGRCGSSSFIKACEHINNYSCAHESLAGLIGKQRLDYPLQHIEADNRLSWFLGRLDKQYANNAFYVHLHRDKQQCINSFSKREDFGIMQAYRQAILLGAEQTLSAEDIAADYLDTVEANIQHFLKDKTHKMSISLSNINTDFKLFWKNISAQGKLEAALNEWNTCYNQS